MLRAPRALPWLAGLLALYLTAPFLAGLAQIGTADWAGADLPGLAGATLVSIASASLATLLVAIAGIPLGYLLARSPGRAARALGVLVQLPLALPPLASGILLLFLFGYASPLGRLTGGALTDSFGGIVLAETFVAAPFLVIAARSAFAAADPVLEDVAATLGLAPGAVFRRVSLALAWRGIGAGALLTWLRAFGEFGATVMVAYHPTSLPVFTYVAFGSQGLPAMLPVLAPTLAAACLVLAAGARHAGRPSRPPIAAPIAAPAIAPALSIPALPLAFAFRRRRAGFTLDVAWSVSARRLAILGASGSGKSATLRLLAGLDPADHATASLGTTDLASLAPHRRGIAYVPQTYGLLPHLTVAQQIRFAPSADPALAEHWTARLGLTPLLHRRPAELSLGQQQRTALARALARPCRLLLLDEPFSALDAPLRARLRTELRALQDEIAATAIIVTHDPDEAFQLADELLLLRDGHVLQSGPACRLFLRPASEIAARLLGATWSAAGHGAGRVIVLDGLALPVAGPPLAPGPVGWTVRPSQIRLVPEGGWPASIVAADPPCAGQRRLTLRLGGVTLPALAPPGAPAEPGPCRIAIDPASIQVWPAATVGPEHDGFAMSRHHALASPA